MTREEALELLADLNPEALTADGFENCLVGICEAQPARAVYSTRACIRKLIDEDGLGEEEADEHFRFNVAGAYVGPHGPVFVEFVDENDGDD